MKSKTISKNASPSKQYRLNKKLVLTVSIAIVLGLSILASHLISQNVSRILYDAKVAILLKNEEKIINDYWEKIRGDDDSTELDTEDNPENIDKSDWPDYDLYRNVVSEFKFDFFSTPQQSKNIKFQYDQEEYGRKQASYKIGKILEGKTYAIFHQNTDADSITEGFYEIVDFSGYDLFVTHYIDGSYGAYHYMYTETPLVFYAQKPGENSIYYLQIEACCGFTPYISSENIGTVGQYKIEKNLIPQWNQTSRSMENFYGYEGAYSDRGEYFYRFIYVVEKFESMKNVKKVDSMKGEPIYFGTSPRGLTMYFMKSKDGMTFELILLPKVYFSSLNNSIDESGNLIPQITWIDGVKNESEYQEKKNNFACMLDNYFDDIDLSTLAIIGTDSWGGKVYGPKDIKDSELKSQYEYFKTKKSDSTMIDSSDYDLVNQEELNDVFVDYNNDLKYITSLETFLEKKPYFFWVNSYGHTMRFQKHLFYYGEFCD